MDDADGRPRSMRNRRLTAEEVELWRLVAKTIDRRPGSFLPDPVAQQHKTRAAPGPQAHAPRLATADPYTPPQDTAKPGLPKPAPLERRLKQRLNRGRLEVDDVLDLHGMHQGEAHSRLRRFIQAAHVRGARIVLVVTGKGRSSTHLEPHERQTGVLRRLAPHWLHASDMLPMIIGFEEAGPAHGGAGALYIRLRRPDRVS